MTRLGEIEQAKKISENLALFRSGIRQRNSNRKPDQRAMTEDVFWELIEETGNEKITPTEQVDRLTERLEAFGLREIRRFQKTLDQKMADSYAWDMWALAFIIRKGCSDDEFDYFRAWLIMQGRDIFEQTLADIQSFRPIKSGFDPQCEYLLYTAENAYENKKGEPMKPVTPLERQLSGGEWSEDELLDRFPDVCAQHGYVSH